MFEKKHKRNQPVKMFTTFFPNSLDDPWISKLFTNTQHSHSPEQSKNTENGAKVCVNDDLAGSPTANIADEFSSVSVKEFLENSDIDEDSIIVFNKVDSSEDLDLLESANGKLLPVYSKSNTKGALSLVEAISEEDALELLKNTLLSSNKNSFIFLSYI